MVLSFRDGSSNIKYGLIEIKSIIGEDELKKQTELVRTEAKWTSVIGIDSCKYNNLLLILHINVSVPIMQLHFVYRISF